MRLLVGGKHVDHAVHRLGRAIRVQRAHHENAHFRCGHGDAHGLQVAQLSDENHVRVLAQRRVQRGSEAGGVLADLALAYEAVLAVVYEFDGVFDREDVAAHTQVDIVDHRGERRGLAGARLARDQDQAVIGLGHLPHGFRQLQLIEGQRLGRNRAEDCADAVELAHDVDAEAPALGNGVGEIGPILGFEPLERRLGHDLVERLLHEIRRELLRPQGGEIAVQADARRIAGDEMQVGSLPLEDFDEIRVDHGHGGSSSGRCGGRRRSGKG